VKKPLTLTVELCENTLLSNERIGFLGKAETDMFRKVCVLVVVCVVLCCSCKKNEKEGPEGGEKQMADIGLESSVFSQNGMIPSKYTCDGQDISPPLSWAAVPDGTTSIALIADDPDAPLGTFVHWVLFNLPGDKGELSENVPKEKTLPEGAAQGINGFRKVGYGGPCPPSGAHRYYFKMYALDKKLELEPGANKPELLAAMEGHILGKGKLMGRYERQ